MFLWSLLFQSPRAFVEIPTAMPHAGSSPVREHSHPNLANWIVVAYTAECLLEEFMFRGLFYGHRERRWVIICTS